MIQLAMLLDGEEVETPPGKDNYIVDISCDNATGKWDTNEWGAIVTNITSGKVKCEVNFTTPAPTMSEVTATSEKTSIALSYTASGIGTSTVCKYGTEEGNYVNTIEEATNTNCNITGLEPNITYYYQICTVNGAGEVCKIGSIKTKALQLADNVEIGDYISMTPTSTSYTISKDLTGCTSDQTINPSELNLWRVISKKNDGTVEVVSQRVSSKYVYFYGQTGFVNFVGALNTIASQYTNTRYVERTRHMGYSNQTETCTKSEFTSCPSDVGYKSDVELITKSIGSLKSYRAGISSDEGVYFVASRGWNGSGSAYVRKVINGKVLTQETINSYEYIFSSSIGEQDQGGNLRPIVTLKSNSEISGGSGSSTSPYTLK